VLGVAFLASTHLYLVQRLVLEPPLPGPLRAAGVALVVALALSLVAAPVAERTLRPARARWVAWPAALWMGTGFLLLVLLLASDAALWLAGGVARAAETGAADASGGASATGWRAALVAGLAFTAAGLGLRSALRPPRVVRREFTIERWPAALDGFRIVQISDVHIGPILGRDFAAALVERVNALGPDLVAVTGDLVDGSVALLADEVAPFAGLRAPHGVFFVTGNHDCYSGAASWTRAVERLGMQPLRNRRVEVRRGDAVFDLVGVDDHHAHRVGEGGCDLARALDGRDPERPAVLLAHDPATFRRASREAIDLQLSGHTHGGQIWPFVVLVRLATPWVAGRYREGRAQLYVSRGTGFWGPPMRLGSPAEITEIVLRGPGAGAPPPEDPMEKT